MGAAWPTAHRLRPASHEWLSVTAFVAPATGESRWYLGNGVSKSLFLRLIALFNHEAGAREQCSNILLLDGAGWHTELGLRMPEGLRLIDLPPPPRRTALVPRR